MARADEREANAAWDPTRPSPLEAFRPVRRPFVGFAITLVLGTVAGLNGWGSPGVLLLAAAFFLAGGWLLHRRMSGTLFLHAAVLVLSCLHAHLAVQSPSARELRSLLARPGEYIDLVGVVASDPVAEPGYREGETRWRFFVELEGLNRIGDWQRARGDLVCYWRTTSNARPAYGDRCLFTGLVQEPDPARERGRYRFLYRLTVDNAEYRLLSTGQGRPLMRACYEGRRACARTLSRGLESYPDERGLLQALLLGYRHMLPQRLYRSFASTGTLHIFAISGLHVGVMAYLIIAALRAVGLSRRYWILCLGPLLLLYTLSTGMKASAVRALLMAVAYWMAPLLGRKPDAPTALAMAAILILGYEPVQLADPGFIFSFTIVTGLVVLVPRWMGPARLLVQDDPWRLRRGPPRMLWFRKILWGVLSLAVVSGAAWICSTPLTARFFNMFSPVALVGNLLVVPLAFVVVFTGCLSVLSGFAVPFLAEVFNHANRFFISLLLSGIEAFRSIPGGHRFVVAPPSWMLAVWYSGLVAMVMLRGRAGRVAAVVAVTLLCLGGAQRWFDRSVTMDVLDVGEGQAVLINLPGSGDVLVDAGSRYRVRNVLRHLRAEGVNRLRVLVLTHADADHVGGVLDVMDAVAVDEVWLSPFPGRSTAYVPVIEEAGRRGIPVRKMNAGHSGEWGAHVGWEMLSPYPDGRYRHPRDGTLVLRVARDAWSVLLMGGAGTHVEQGLLAKPCSLAATVLVSGDPARSGRYSDEWLAAVEPDYLVLSVSGRDRGGYLDPSALDRMAKDSIRVLRTDRQGHIRFRFRPGLLGPAGQPEVETVRGDEDLSV